MMDVGILGPLRVGADGSVLDVRGARERTLLVALSTRAGEAVRTDRLVEALWSLDRTPANVTNSLHAAVRRLRRQLGSSGGDLLLRQGPGYLLAVSRDDVDALRFERLLADAATHPDREVAARLLEDALSLWRGEAMADVEAHGWLDDLRARWEDMRLRAIEDRNSALLAAGEAPSLVTELEHLVRQHPLRESLRAQLMTALHRSGRPADALALYDETRRVLADELGVDPSPELRELHHAILTEDAALGAEPESAPATRLPERLTSFVGRNPEIEELDDLLAAHRLVTVIGPGGVGKTSLAVAAAQRHARDHSTETYFVDLAPVREARRVTATLLTALGFRRDGASAGGVDPLDRLTAFLRPRRALLLVDNCEHVVAECARVVNHLLSGCPDITVLATSREVLGVPGETVWGTPPLRLPAAEDDPRTSDAVVLFLERAGSADPHFRPGDADHRHIAAICTRLDGLPLAIELAAARVRALPPAEIAARLDDRFRLLVGGVRVSAPRQQTLRAAVDWSYGLLTPDEAEMFRRLAIFVAPWTLHDAEAVCADASLPTEAVLPLAVRLVDRSLVTREAGGRFRLLETMRSYAADICDASTWASLRERHTAYFLSLSEELGRSPADADLLHRLELAVEDVGAAIEHAVDSGSDRVALRFAGALGWMWATFHIAEGHRRMAQIMERAQPSISLEFGRALQAVAYVESYLPSPRTKLAALRSIVLLQRFGDTVGAARSRLITAFIEMMQSGDTGWAARLTDDADAAASLAGDDWTRALAALTRFRLALDAGDLTSSLDHGRDALSRFSALGDPWGVPWTTIWLAVALRTTGHLTEARSLLEPVAAGLPGTSYAASLALQELGNLSALSGRDEEAEAAHTRALTLATQSGVPVLQAFAHDAAGFGAHRRGALREAGRHYESALTTFGDLSYPPGRDRARCGLGLVLLHLGEHEQAERLLLTAAHDSQPVRRTEVFAAAAEGLAVLWSSRDPRGAAMLLGAAGSLRDTHGTRCGALETSERSQASVECRRRLGEAANLAAIAEGRRRTFADLLTPPAVAD